MYIMKNKEKRLTIGVLSHLTFCKIETIRYYEKIGIFPIPPGTEGGHRIYSEKNLKRIVFIRRGRDLGFSLEDIRALLRLVDGGDHTCGQVQKITLHHLENIRRDHCLRLIQKRKSITKFKTTLLEYA